MTTKVTNDGLILLNKPAGMTSFDCVRDLKRKLGTKDVGHGGTLDSFATGVLPVLVGDGLKIARFFLDASDTLPTYWKTYRANLILGRETTTADPTGETLIEKPIPAELSLKTIEAAVAPMLAGPYLQTPPVYSAKKIAGERASDLARAGEAPKLKAVPVKLKNFVIHRANTNSIEFTVTVSKGTYIRSIGVDLARALGTAGHLSSLHRVSVGPFEDVQCSDGIIGIDEATAFLPTVTVSDEEARDVVLGRLQRLFSRITELNLSRGVYCLRLAPNEASPRFGCAVALVETTECGLNFLRAFRPRAR